MEPILKVFGADAWHSSVTIVGNKVAIENLIQALQEAIDGGSSTSEFSETDGEYYDLDIKLFDHDSESVEWNKLPMHYTDEMASTKDKQKWNNLWDLFTELIRLKKIKRIESGNNQN
jgi:hypothetical protein